jgi:hypothetical protein
VGIETDQLHERFVAEQLAGQGIDALNPKQGLHAVAQDILEERNPVGVDAGAMSLLQQRHHTDGPPKVQAVIQQHPLIQPIHAIDQWLAVQAAGYPGIVAPSDLPAQPLRRILCDLVTSVPHSPPSAVACAPAIEESG